MTRRVADFAPGAPTPAERQAGCGCLLVLGIVAVLTLGEWQRVPTTGKCVARALADPGSYAEPLRAGVSRDSLEREAAAVCARNPHVYCRHNVDALVCYQQILVPTRSWWERWWPRGSRDPRRDQYPPPPGAE